MLFHSFRYIMHVISVKRRFVMFPKMPVHTKWICKKVEKVNLKFYYNVIYDRTD